jgi:hypothetical protein
VTSTPESEYSATVIPGRSEIAVVRVEADSTQRLWAFPLGGGEPRLLFEKIKPVGYQAWLDGTTVCLFVLGSPATLQVADRSTGASRVLLADIGRSLHRIPGRRTVSVTHRVDEGAPWLVEVDPASGTVRPLVRMPAGVLDYAWAPDGSVLAGMGNRIYRFRPGRDREFAPVAELSGRGLEKIGRIAVSPRGDFLAVVSDEAS